MNLLEGLSVLRNSTTLSEALNRIGEDGTVYKNLPANVVILSVERLRRRQQSR